MSAAVSTPFTENFFDVKINNSFLSFFFNLYFYREYVPIYNNIIKFFCLICPPEKNTISMLYNIDIFTNIIPHYYHYFL